MDSISQIALGAAVAEVGLGKHIGNKALVWGALVGTLPDLDFIPGKMFNDVQQLLFHRGISHSFTFFAGAAAFLTFLFIKIHKKNSPNHKKVYLTLFLVLATHALLDACTTWGTSLLWPFSDHRFSLGCIAIIDPLYTFPLLICLGLLLFFKKDTKFRMWLNLAGLSLSSIYLISSFINQQWMLEHVKRDLQQRKMTYEEVSVRPSLFNTILWQIAVRREGYYLLGYRSWLDQSPQIEYDSVTTNQHLIQDWRGHHDLETLIHITNHHYAIEKNEDGSLILHDLRYGRIGFGDHARFVFSYRLITDDSGQLHEIKRSTRQLNNASERVHELIERLKGI